MLRKIIWCFVLCGYVNYVKLIAARSATADFLVKNNMIGESKMNSVVTEAQSAQTRRNLARTERGIVMVDSDFDIPSEIYSYENNGSEEFGKNDGSGATELDEIVKTTEEEIDGETEFPQTTNQTFKPKPSTSAELLMTEITDGKSIFTSDIMGKEGSGDEKSPTTPEYSSSEITTKNYIKPEVNLQEKIPDVCLNSSCTVDNLAILTSDESCVIPEGTNFTLTCMSNNSDFNMLYWYKSNGSEHYLQAFGTKVELTLNVVDIKPIHSGTYMCIKWVNKQKCCNMQSTITIYEVPLYKYHLIIISLVVIACLIICILLSIRQSIQFKKYTKQFAEKHGDTKEQFL